MTKTIQIESGNEIAVEQFEILHQAKGIRHMISRRIIDKPSQFSMAYHTNEPAGDISSNRDQLASMMDDGKFVSALQVHGAHIHIVDKHESRGWYSLDRSLQADAMVTDVLGVGLGILTADCVPVLIYDPAHHAIGAVHAGWQGTNLEIVKQTIETMRIRYGSHTRDMLVGIGPAIDKCCYQVGHDVARHFESYPKALMSTTDEKYMLDLKYINRKQLLSIGIKPEHIETSPICTSCQHQIYFSHRRSGGGSGRFMSIIKLID